MSATHAHPAGWCLSLPCTRAEAELLTLADEHPALALLDEPPVLTTTEPDPDKPAQWRLDAYFSHRPDDREIAAVLALAPGRAMADIELRPLPAIDWVTHSQSGLEPIRAGRFLVRNSPDDAVDPGCIDLLIPASQAFGTGQHETTRGCLLMLGRLRARGHRFGNVADIGTGTGLLAFAALRLWPRAHALASDIDPVAIEVARGNAALNRVLTGPAAGAVMLVAAPGVDHPALVGRAPYDLVIANILAGPLVELAPGLAAQLAEGGSLLLAGLLESQEARVLAAYRARGLHLVARIGQGDWPTLLLRKRRRSGWRRPVRWDRARHGEAPGFGSF